MSGVICMSLNQLANQSLGLDWRAGTFSSQQFWNPNWKLECLFVLTHTTWRLPVAAALRKPPVSWKVLGVKGTPGDLLRPPLHCKRPVILGLQKSAPRQASNLRAKGWSPVIWLFHCFRNQKGSDLLLLLFHFLLSWHQSQWSEGYGFNPAVTHKSFGSGLYIWRCSGLWPSTGDSRADPGFWSGMPSRVLTPEGARVQNFALNMGFPLKLLENCMILKKYLGGKGRPGPPGPPWIRWRDLH